LGHRRGRHPDPAKEESDFLASFGDTKVLIEEKTKLEDPAFLAQRAQVLDSGEVHSASLSPNYAALKASPVVAAFGDCVEDPLQRESEGVSFVVDGDIDRNDEAALLAYLQKKYGTVPLMKFDLGHLSASVRVAVSAD
jgi:hypothetical protein